MSYANSFRDLEVYKLSRELAKEVFEMTKKFPAEEKYSLTDQIRRSSRSVGAQVAEAWAKRRYEKHFISKLTDADGELQETQHWVEVSCDCKYITNEKMIYVLDKCFSLGKMVSAMMSKSNQFCQNIH
jgi:four helix bundle protein